MLLAEIQVTIARVKKMEKYLDEVLESLRNMKKGNTDGISKNEIQVQRQIKILMNYYESGLWLHDYECDERGELPRDLKRGVLAEDTLYNLLAEIL